MPKHSAGILLYRTTNTGPEFFLVHPGGPFFKNKDDGAWSIPKGEFDADEDPLVAARREFEEETGVTLKGHFLPLTPITQKGGKVIQAWAVEGDIDSNNIKSNTFTIEWPPRSGKMATFPEVDRAGWFGYDDAVKKINAAQVGFLDEVLSKE
jgi:predicted NUDIX family NTP pyrophosphohydrolase